MLVKSAGEPRRLQMQRLVATGLDVGLGSRCRISSHSRNRSVLAEVVGFHARGVLLMPLDLLPERARGQDPTEERLQQPLRGRPECAMSVGTSVQSSIGTDTEARL